MSKLAVILQGDPALFQSAFTRGGLQASMLAGDPGFFGFIKQAISGVKQIFGTLRRPPATTTEGVLQKIPVVGGAITLSKIEAIVRRHPELAAVLGAAGIAVPAIGAARVIGRAAGAIRERLGRRDAVEPGMRRRRGRGITAAQLKGFKKVTRLLGSLGMVPRHLGHVRVQRGRRRKF